MKKIVNIEEVEYDNVIYVDTDSCFSSALPIIKKNIPDIDLNDDRKMTDAILKVTNDVQLFVNNFYDIMAMKFFNLEKHRFDAKQEVISKTSFWLAKKRYAQLIINKSGIECNELEVKGIDVVRTSFPIRFKTFMEGFLQNILRKVSKETIDVDILKLVEELPTYSIIEIAKNTSVKFKSLDGKKDYNPKTRHTFKYVLGTPAQAKAALFYNDLLTHFGLSKEIPKIMHGQKIKWVYLNQNEYGSNSIAMKADGTDPQRILEFIEKYIDRTSMYEQELKSKLVDFYDILNWSYPSPNDVKIDEFFKF